MSVSTETHHEDASAVRNTPHDLPRGHMVALLPRGEAWRNFVYTGLLEGLAGDVDLTVLSVRPSERLWDLMCERFGDLRELVAVHERWPARFQRELLDLAHGRWLWSEASKERWRLRDVEAVTPLDKVKRAAKKGFASLFAHQPGLTFLEGTADVSSRWLRTSDHYLKLYRELRPSLVFNASHVHSVVAQPAVRAARWLGIPTATFLFSWDNLTSQGRIMPPYDYYLVWNEAIRDQLLSLYPKVRRDRVFVTGTPQFDAHFQPKHFWTREEFCQRVNAEPARPLVLYTTGMANHMPGEPDIVRGIADMLKEMPERPQLLLRVYPKDRTNRFDALLKERPDIINAPAPWEREWLTPLVEDTEWLTNSLRHVDLGINVASTVSLELCMFDKPVLNVGYNPPGVRIEEVEYKRYYSFDHYRPIVDSGAVDVAYSSEEMRKLLIDALARPQARTEERRRLLHLFFGDTLDGNSAGRATEVLKHLAKRSVAAK